MYVTTIVTKTSTPISTDSTGAAGLMTRGQHTRDGGELLAVVVTGRLQQRFRAQSRDSRDGTAGNERHTISAIYSLHFGGAATVNST